MNRTSTHIQAPCWPSMACGHHQHTISRRLPKSAQGQAGKVRHTAKFHVHGCISNHGNTKVYPVMGTTGLTSKHITAQIGAQYAGV